MITRSNINFCRERTLGLLVDFAKAMDSDIKNSKLWEGSTNDAGALEMLWFLIIDENAHIVKLDVQVQALKKYGKILGFFQFRSKR